VFAFLVAARFADPIVSLSPYQFARDTVFLLFDARAGRLKDRLLLWHCLSNVTEIRTGCTEIKYLRAILLGDGLANSLGSCRGIEGCCLHNPDQRETS
jgi:hypothetical protein